MSPNLRAQRPTENPPAREQTAHLGQAERADSLFCELEATAKSSQLSQAVLKSGTWNSATPSLVKARDMTLKPRNKKNGCSV